MYYNHKAVSSSLLKACIKSELDGYSFLTKPREQTPAMLLGSYIHALWLDGLDDYAVAPDVDRRTKEGKAIYADFEASSQGKIVVPFDMHNTAKEVTDALYKSKPAFDLFGSATGKEKELLFEIDDTPCKAKIDMICGDTLVDLKTISTEMDERSLSNTIYYNEIYTQMAFYQEAISRSGLQPVNKYKIIFVNTKPPYLVKVVNLTQSWIDLGAQRCEHFFPVAKKLIEGYIPTQPTTELEIDIPAWIK